MNKKTENKIKFVLKSYRNVGVEIFNDAIIIRSSKLSLTDMYVLYKKIYGILLDEGKYRYFLPLDVVAMPRFKVNNKSLSVEDSKYESSKVGTEFVALSDLLTKLFDNMRLTEKMLIELLDMPSDKLGADTINALGALSDTIADKTKELFLLQGPNSAIYTNTIADLIELLVNVGKGKLKTHHRKVIPLSH